MARDIVTNNQLYTAIMEIHKKIDDVVDKRITPLELWRAEITGKLTLLLAVFAVGFNVLIDWVKTRFFKNV